MPRSSNTMAAEARRAIRVYWCTRGKGPAREAVSRPPVAFCGLAWDERCLRFNDTERVVRTASVLQVRHPMYRSSVVRWQRYEAHLQPLLEVLRRLT